MGKGICVAAEVAKQTHYKTLQAAFANHEFEVILFPREGYWLYEGNLDPKIYGYLQKEIATMYPEYQQVQKNN